MKNFKKILCVVLAMVLCLSCTTPAMAASAKYTKATKAYNSWLKQTKKWPNTPRYYDIVDIDGNGIPELLVSTMVESIVYTYNTKTSKMVKLIRMDKGKLMGTGVTYNTKKKMFSLVIADTGGSRTRYYKLNGTKITKTAAYEYRNARHYPGGPYYLINGKKYSESTYNKKYESARKNFKEPRYMQN